MSNLNYIKLDSSQILIDVGLLLRSTSSILFTFAQDLVEPIFDEKIPTARVEFDLVSNKCILFKINPLFWNSLNQHEKFFLFVHEILHVLFDHGNRGETFINSLPKEKQSRDLLNKAMDIAINEIVLETYVNYPLALMPEIKKGCFIQNCFSDASTILRDQTFDYYYMKLLEESEDSIGQVLDIHSFLSGISSEELSELLEEFYGVEKIEETDDLEEIELQDGKGYTISNVSSSGINVIQLIKDRTYSVEDVLKLSLASAVGQNPDTKKKTNWYKMNRRTNMTIPKNMTLPITEVKLNKKYKIVCYCDVSGSVASVSKKFFHVVHQLDEKLFEKEVFVFADRVGKVSKVNGSYTYSNVGGGTNINQVLQHYDQMKQKADYVIVLTDGEYYPINNREDDKFKSWHFFYTSYTKNHPIKSKFTLLRELLSTHF